MYQIYADDTLIYDSTIEDYKISKGTVTLEVDKSGSFVFALYPEHFYYDRLVRMKTVVTVYKSGRIIFRGRVLKDETDYWNNKVVTCEGERGFLQDSVTRPFSFQGSHVALFRQFIEEHNAQVDEFKRFKIGTVTVEDSNEYINRSSTDYGNTLSTIESALTGSALGGHFFITHGDDGTDPVPTIHYLADFTEEATQTIEFGVNLKNYARTIDGAEVATAIIPLGAEVESTGKRLTVESVNGGVDYIYNETAVALRGWIIKPVVWDEVILAQNLLKKGQAYLDNIINQNITIELNAIDLHLLDRSIESFRVCDNIRVVSEPHGLDAVMLCNKQTIDLLKPESDTVTLGYHSVTFTDSSMTMAANIETVGRKISSVQQTAESISLSVKDLEKDLGQTLCIGADGVTITNAAGSAVTIDGGQIDASTINASQIDASQINAANLNMSGCISYGDLSESLQGTLDDVEDTVDDWGYTYNGETYIDGSKIMAGTVIASTLMGGEVSLITKNENEAGYIDITGSSSSSYAIELGSNGALRLVANNGTAYLESNSGGALQVSDYVGVDGCKIAPGYNDDGDYSCGDSSQRWSDIYCINSTIETSDLTEKKEVVYGLADYERFFDGLKPISFLFVNGTSGRRHLGMGAQDVEALMEESGLSSLDFAGFVKSPKIDAEGKQIEGEYVYALRYGEFIPLCIEQIQSLKKRVAELEKEVE